MANYELIALNEAGPDLRAPTAADTGTIAGNLQIDGDVSGAGGALSITDSLAVGSSANPETNLDSITAANGAPASTGTAPANAAFRLRSTATSGCIDMGLNGSTPWIQATDRTDLSQTYTLSLNPNGGAVTIGGALAVTGAATVTGGFGVHGESAQAQASHIADASDLASAITAINAALVVIENLGFVAKA